MRGRKPNPEKIAGTPDGPVGTEINEPAWVVVTAPDWAAGVAQLAAEKWRELADAMDELDTLGPENVPALEMLCKQYARWRMAEAQVDKLGPVIRAPVTGVPMHNPFLSVANQAADRFIKLAAELGLTPAMRGRVGKRSVKQATAAAPKTLSL